MPKKTISVTIDRKTAEVVLDRMKTSAHAHLAVYNRKTKNFDFDDAAWKRGEPYEFDLATAIRDALANPS